MTADLRDRDAGPGDGVPPDEVLASLAATARLLVCCDFDGTISMLADEPSAARPVDGAVAALDTLAGLPDTWSAIISGRSLIDLTQLAGVGEGVHLVGSHGTEFEVGSILAFGPSEATLRDVVAGQCAALVRGVPGVLVETKPASIAVHVRRADPHVAVSILSAVRAGPGSLAGVRVLEGKDVVELAVMSGGKGDAIDVLRSRWSVTATLFVGDDRTDEDAFAVLGVDDVGVKVDEGESEARWRLPDPASVVDLLRRLAVLRAG